MSVVCTVCIYRVSIKSVCTLEKFNFIYAHGLYGHPVYYNRIFQVFLKFKRGMPAVGSMTTPLRVYNICFEFIVLSSLCWP